MADYGGLIVNGNNSKQLDSTITDFGILFTTTMKNIPAGQLYPNSPSVPGYFDSIPSYVSIDDVVIFGVIISSGEVAWFEDPKHKLYYKPVGLPEVAITSPIVSAKTIMGLGYSNGYKPDYGVIVNNSQGGSIYSSGFKSIKVIKHVLQDKIYIWYDNNAAINITIPSGITKLGIVCNQSPCETRGTFGDLMNSSVYGAKMELTSSTNLRISFTRVGKSIPMAYDSGGHSTSSVLDIVLLDCSHL